MATPERVIKASLTVPALSDTDRNAIQAIKLEKSTDAQGTPTLFTVPRMRGALPFRAMKSIVREEMYSEEFPALMTAMTMTELMSEAPAWIRASESAIVRGDAVVFEPLPRSRWSLKGIRMPMKNIMPT